VKLQLLAFYEIYFYKIIAGKIYPDQHHEHHLPGADAGNNIDSIDSARKKKEREYHDGLIEAETGIDKLYFFFTRPFFLRHEKSVKPDHGHNEKKRDKDYEILLQTALSYAEEKSYAPHRKKNTQDYRKISISGYPKRTGGTQKKKQNHGAHGKAETFEEYIQHNIKKNAGNDELEFVLDV
jgi:hypothetical protein